MAWYKLKIQKSQPGFYRDIKIIVSSFQEVKQAFIDNGYITEETKVKHLIQFGIVKMSLKEWYGRNWKETILSFSSDQWYDEFFGKYWYDTDNWIEV